MWLVSIVLISAIGNSQQETLLHQQALGLVNSAGITVTSSGQCSNRRNSQCTSLDGIHREAIDGIITLKRASGCQIVITGGTETGHASVGSRSHHNGWKLDICKRGDDCITDYITRTFTKISANRWRAASRNIYLNEGNHWDIQYRNAPRHHRRSMDDHHFNDSIPTQEITGINGEEAAMMDDQLWAEKSGDGAANFVRDTRSTDRCLQCICQVESSCCAVQCSWDVNSHSCSYFQIKKGYYEDCNSPGRRRGESMETAWKRCALDYNCSVQCITNYVNRYGRKCSNVGYCQKIARLHNGGPSGCQKSATIRYWNLVNNCL